MNDSELFGVLLFIMSPVFFCLGIMQKQPELIILFLVLTFVSLITGTFLLVFYKSDSRRVQGVVLAIGGERVISFLSENAVIKIVFGDWITSKAFLFVTCGFFLGAILAIAGGYFLGSSSANLPNNFVAEFGERTCAEMGHSFELWRAEGQKLVVQCSSGGGEKEVGEFENLIVRIRELAK